MAFPFIIPEEVGCHYLFPASLEGRGWEKGGVANFSGKKKIKESFRRRPLYILFSSDLDFIL